MHLHHLLPLLLVTLLTTLPLTTPLPLNSNSTDLSTTTTTTTALTLTAPPSCPRYRIRHGGHLRYRLSRLRTACRPQKQPQARLKEVGQFDNARSRTAPSPAGERRAGSSARRVVGESPAAPDL